MKSSILLKHFLFLLLGLSLSSSTFASNDRALNSTITAFSSVCDMAAGLHESNITETSATLHWSMVPGAVSYSVQTRLPNGSWYYVPGSPFMNNYVTVNNLNPGTTYEWRVRTNCAYGESSAWTWPETFTTQGSYSCNAPTWLSTINITQTTATFDWSAASGAESYSIQWRYPGGTWYNLGGGPFYNTWVSVGGLDPATDYEWRVRSNCANGSTSEWSYAASFTTLGNSCDTPTGLHVTNITQTSATLHWDDVYEAQSFSVQTRLPGGTWYYVQGSPFTNTWVTVNGLNPGTTYEWRVRSNCGYGYQSNWSYPQTFTTSGSYSCEAPDYLTTLNITQTTATFDWDPAAGAVSYSIQWRYAGGNWNNLAGGPWYNTSITVGGLQPGTAYEWRVRSNCSNYVYSEWSYPAAFTTLPASCSTPEELYTSNVTDHSATFHWSPVSGAQSYSVQIRLPNGYWEYITGSPFYGTSATVHGLTPGTTYEWRVRANCGYGHHSSWSLPMTFTTSGSFACEAPAYLTTLNITQTSASFDWDPASGAVSYSVQWRYPGGTWYNLAGGPWYNTWLNVGGLQPGTTYEWRVRSNCSNGQYSEWSYPATFTTLPSSCSTPTGLATTNVTEISATFSWNPVPGAHSYSVQIRLPNGYWSFITGSPFTGTSATAYNLNPGTSYEWRVRANCGYGHHSYWSAPMSFTTLGSSDCEVPDYLNTLNIGQTTATFDWDASSGAVSYTVQWRYPGGTWTNFSGGPWYNTWVNVGGLTPGTDYEWRVRANCANGMVSEWSEGVPFTTLTSSCSVPVGLSTSNIGETSATFNWEPVVGAQNYSVQSRLPGGTWNFVPNSPFTGTSATVSWFNPGTTYEWRVRANCGTGDHSAWSNPMTFTTLGTNAGNDFCSDAMWLTVNDDCVFTAVDNIDATASTPPPMGGCSSAGYQDVWYRFNMPSTNNPIVTIRTSAGSLTDAVMEIYYGSSCSYLTFLGCEDDNNNGNGSDMPVISISGGAGATIWVRIWGHSGTEGTFDICVFDHHSYNQTDGGTTFVVPVDGESLSPVDEEVAIDAPVLTPSYMIAPNPVSDVLSVTYVQTKESIVTGLAMMDMSGKILLRKEYQNRDANEFNEKLDVSSLTPGMYILQIMTSTGIVSEKVSVVE